MFHLSVGKCSQVNAIVASLVSFRVFITWRPLSSYVDDDYPSACMHSHTRIIIVMIVLRRRRLVSCFPVTKTLGHGRGRTMMNVENCLHDHHRVITRHSTVGLRSLANHHESGCDESDQARATGVAQQSKRRFCPV